MDWESEDTVRLCMPNAPNAWNPPNKQPLNKNEIAQSCRHGSSWVNRRLGWWRRRHVESCVLGHHSGRKRVLAFEMHRRAEVMDIPLESDTDALNDGQKDGAADGTVSNSLCTTTNGESTSGKETGNDGVPRILLLADALDSAVECREHAAPDTEVTTENRSACLDCGKSCKARSVFAACCRLVYRTSYPSLAVRTVSETFDTVPYYHTLS